MLNYLGQLVLVNTGDKKQPGIYIGKDDKTHWVYTYYDGLSDPDYQKDIDNTDVFSFEATEIFNVMDDNGDIVHGSLCTWRLTGVLTKEFTDKYHNDMFKIILEKFEELNNDI